MDFPQWFTQQMDGIGYNRSHTHDETASLWMNFTDGKDDFHVMYLRAPMTPEAIKITFASHNLPVLFVVDVKAFDFRQPMTDSLWLTALHAIYYGRVYVFTEYEAGIPSIRAVHFDREKQQYSSAEVDLTGILFTDTDCKLRDFPGLFHIARFYDRAFWKEGAAPQPKRERKGPRTNANEQYWKQEYKRQTTEDVFRDFREAFERNKRQYQQASEPPRRTPPNPFGDRWLQGFMSTGNLATARLMYKQLAKEWHPDLNPGKPQALETMQAINSAFDRAKEILV